MNVKNPNALRFRLRDVDEVFGENNVQSAVNLSPAPAYVWIHKGPCSAEKINLSCYSNLPWALFHFCHCWWCKCNHSSLHLSKLKTFFSRDDMLEKWGTGKRWSYLSGLCTIFSHRLRDGSQVLLWEKCNRKRKGIKPTWAKLKRSDERLRLGLLPFSSLSQLADWWYFNYNLNILIFFEALQEEGMAEPRWFTVYLKQNVNQNLSLVTVLWFSLDTAGFSTPHWHQVICPVCWLLHAHPPEKLVLHLLLQRLQIVRAVIDR